MCTFVLLRRPGHRWPLIVGANRDEMKDRPWKPPARHWADRPEVVAGLDELAQGSWLGVNDHGVVAAIMNRHETLGPAAGKRSRGELVLEALDHADAADAAGAFADLNPDAYRGFNMVVADNRDAFLITLKEPTSLTGDVIQGVEKQRRTQVEPIPEGLHMITAFALDDTRHDPRIRLHLPRFADAPPPDPDRSDWAAWSELMASPDFESDSRTGAMCFELETGFGTSSAAQIALPAPEVEIEQTDAGPVFRFAPGPPCRAAFEPVDV